MRFVCVLVTTSFVGALALVAHADEPEVPEDLVASTLQVEDAPVAVITPLPDAVSNGTWWSLSAAQSYALNGSYIRSYTWELEYGNTTEEFYGKEERYKFRVTGLYKIRLTVVDGLNRTGVNFTAVYSVPDSDLDGIADWWEVKYFLDLSPTAEGDPDGDGYSNIEEYVRMSNPLEADPKEGIIEANWKYITIAAIVAIAIFAALYPRHRRKKKDQERRKMEYAIEIQRALDED